MRVSSPEQVRKVRVEPFWRHNWRKKVHKRASTAENEAAGKDTAEIAGFAQTIPARSRTSAASFDNNEHQPLGRFHSE
jgi:hypothetical protein